MQRILLVALSGLAIAGSAQAQPLGQPRLLADSNGDGKVTLTEYQASRRNFIMKGDRNRDGRISAKEWTDGAAMLRADFERDGVEGAEQIGRAGGFATLDADKDGYVVPSEIDFWSSRRFPKLDLDHNGSINRTEADKLERLSHRK